MVCDSATIRMATFRSARHIYAEMKKYQNDTLVQKLAADLSLSPDGARTLLEDVKRFLALSAATGRRLSPTPAIDRGWHVFLVFTKNYPAFCQKFCKRMIHHVPENPATSEPRRALKRMQRTVKLASKVFAPAVLSSNWKLPPEIKKRRAKANGRGSRKGCSACRASSCCT